MPDSAAHAEKETARLEAFSDGVFAIAITLLALELKVPHLEGEPLSKALAAGLVAEWPSYFAFLTSFFSVLIMWVHHHMIFRLVRRSDVTLLFANGFLLMLVTVVPFPTSVVAEYLTTSATAAAASFYAGVWVAISLAFYLLLWAAFRASTVDPRAPAATLRRLRRSYAFGPPMYVAALAVGPFMPWLAMAICTAMWVLWAAITREC